MFLLSFSNNRLTSSLVVGYGGGTSFLSRAASRAFFKVVTVSSKNSHSSLISRSGSKVPAAVLASEADSNSEDPWPNAARISRTASGIVRARGKFHRRGCWADHSLSARLIESARPASRTRKSTGSKSIWVPVSVESDLQVEVGELADEVLVPLCFVQGGTRFVKSARDDGVAPSFGFEKEPSSQAWKLEHRIGLDDSVHGVSVSVLLPRKAHRIRGNPLERQGLCIQVEPICRGSVTASGNFGRPRPQSFL